MTTAGSAWTAICFGICERKMVRNLRASAYSTWRPVPPAASPDAALASSGAICCVKKSVMLTRSFVSVAPLTTDLDLTTREMTRYAAASFAFQALCGSAAYWPSSAVT